MPKDILKKYLTGLLAVIITIAVCTFLWFVLIHFIKMHNHERVLSIIEHDLTYEQDKLDEQMDTIQSLINTELLYDEDMGHMYERACEIYSIWGDDVSYYRYLGYALYYLEKADEKSTRVNIYLNLANFYINNYSFDLAERIFDNAKALIPLEDIENAQEKSYAYRIQSLIELNNSEFEEALNSLDLADAALTGPETAVYAEAYFAMNDANRALVYVSSGHYDEAQAIIDEYRGHPLFSQEVYKNVLMRDFMLPYYRTECYLAALNLDQESTKKVITDFMDFCDENGFRQHELHTLLWVVNSVPPKEEEVIITVSGIIYNLYTELFTEQSESYAAGTMAQIDDAISEITTLQNAKVHNTHRNIYVALIFFAAVAMLSLIYVISLSWKRDGLTKVYTRKIFDADLAKLKKQKTEYAILMMDIDNFKHINDTYGHPEGDKVLQTLGAILIGARNRDTRAYRYGGEEFAIIAIKDSISVSTHIAEGIRDSLKREAWTFDPGLHITLSVGIASGSDADDVVKLADENLYTAKTTGKDRVVSSVKQ